MARQVLRAQGPPAGSGKQPGQGNVADEITPHLVALVAERVFAMLLSDLQIEQERWRLVQSSKK